MFTTHKNPNATRADYKYTDVKLASSTLMAELPDAMAEEVCGGAIANPETTGKNNASTPATGGFGNAIPAEVGYGAVGLTPFLPPLPATKLARLGPLDPSTRTAPKNEVTITIPLPTPITGF
ncbi:hypothetical protein NIES4074_40350 [Cylindrospermum sp. NIES-4074]|nr:hypothetical protein NIES4074_40350 [Cylindrospermum sp. NIES-4074]